ncbi:hypothetical protein ACER0C_014854 [Sarotherodon galilaeus]
MRASGCHVPFFSSPFFTGLGYCLSFLPTITILAQYFSRRRALVTSMASSGESVAMFVFAPAFTTLKEHIGWRFCLVILGIIQASVIGGGVLLRPIVIEPEPLKKNDDEMLSMKEMQAVYELENEQTRTSISSDISQGSQDSGVTSLSASNVDLRNAEGETKALMEWKDKVPDKDGEDISLSMPSVQVSEDKGELAELDGGPVRSTGSKLLDFSVLKDPGFICYSLFGLFATLGFFAPQLYIIELSKSRGVESTMASYMLSVMAVADILGRLFIGVVLNKVRFRKTLVLLGCVVLMSLVLVAFTIVWEFWGLAICSGFFGFIMGTVASTHIPMLAEEDVVGIEKMPSSVGVYVFIQSFAGLAGPPLGGMLVDITDNYGAAFYSCAAGTGLSAICLALVGPAKSKACQRVSRVQENAEEVKIYQNSDQSDFLEVDLAPEDSPVGQGEDQDSCVI